MRNLHRLLSGLVLVALTLVLTGMMAGPASAAGVVGNGTPGSCTASALESALTGGGLVTFDCGPAPHTITAWNLLISDDTTIDGGGLITIDGGGFGGVLFVGQGTTLNLQNITISGGSGSVSGGVYNDSGTVTVQSSRITGNTASHDTFGGGGITSAGEASMLTVQNSTISGNSGGNSGGIFNQGTLTVINSVLSGNTGGFRGGAIFNSRTALVEASTLAGNTNDLGGGIFNQGTLTVINSTLFGNSGSSGGGALFEVGGGAMISNSTVSANTGGGISNQFGVVTVRNSIVAQQASEVDCFNDSGAIVSEGYNIESAISCSFTSTGDQQGVLASDLKLGTLADNGGPTQTQALAEGSVAIDHIPADVSEANGCGSTVVVDQRGEPRPANGDGNAGAACDVGAFEVQPPCNGSTDVNGDGVVDIVDVQRVAGDWNNPAFNPCHDVSEDGQVTTDDIIMVALDWGSVFLDSRTEK
ncbi:MAG: choice-of-anchor Q domain-containing protein [Chloroflexota bacterium]|nr:choice-of-anchor Q domain-containing protein [Chloroflexota bacterium]